MFKEIANCINGNKMITDDLIYEMGELFVKINKLQDYVKDIVIVNQELDNCYASYCNETRTIMISRSEIINAIILDECEHLIQSSYTARIINSLYHELVHAIQIKNINDNRESLKNLIFQINILKYYNNKDIYNDNYYDFSMEINAFLISYIKTKELIDYCAKDNFWKFVAIYDITTYFIDIMEQFYYNSSPVERMKIKLPYNFDKKYTNFERISLGLPIDEPTRNKIMTMKYQNAINFKNYINSK